MISYTVYCKHSSNVTIISLNFTTGNVRTQQKPMQGLIRLISRTRGSFFVLEKLYVQSLYYKWIWSQSMLGTTGAGLCLFKCIFSGVVFKLKGWVILWLIHVPSWNKNRNRNRGCQSYISKFSKFSNLHLLHIVTLAAFKKKSGILWKRLQRTSWYIWTKYGTLATSHLVVRDAFSLLSVHTTKAHCATFELQDKKHRERDSLFWAGAAEVKAVVSAGAGRDRVINHMSTNGSSKWALSSDKTSALLCVLLQAPL